MNKLNQYFGNVCSIKNGYDLIELFMTSVRVQFSNNIYLFYNFDVSIIFVVKKIKVAFVKCQIGKCYFLMIFKFGKDSRIPDKGV